MTDQNEVKIGDIQDFPPFTLSNASIDTLVELGYLDALRGIYDENLDFCLRCESQQLKEPAFQMIRHYPNCRWCTVKRLIRHVRQVLNIT